MPELPEVETTLRGIEPWLDQQVIDSVNVRNASLRWPIPPEVNDLTGLSIKRLWRRAKYLLLELSDQSHLIMHLGMSGMMRVVRPDEVYQKHDHFELVMENGYALRLNDPRRFGCVLWTDEPIESHQLLASLGPEPLSAGFDGQWLKQAAGKRTVAVKNLIMNNHVVVGVGNIYASEALFLAGIRPDRQAGRIALQRYQKLATTIKQVLELAIQAGGTTLRDFRRTDGQPGYFKQQLNVYGRADQSCLQCGKTIINITLGQRASYYCPGCQT